MVSYLVQGLLSNSTSLLVEGFTSITTPTTIKLTAYLNSFNIRYSITKLHLTNNTKLSKIIINSKYTTLTMLRDSRLVDYKISNYSYLNKINVN